MGEQVTTAEAMEMLGVSRTVLEEIAKSRRWTWVYRRGFANLYNRDDIEAEVQARAAGKRPYVPGSMAHDVKSKRRTRPCIRCNVAFDSFGPGNRMCGPCRDYSRAVRSGFDE